LKLSPNDPCWCGSQRKHKKCHKAYDEATGPRKYEESQKFYASTWEVTSRLQHDRGDYDWMAQQLKPYEVRRLFDVGCGSGLGLRALLAQLPQLERIIAIDENIHCLRIAQNTLAAAGPAPELIDRIEVEYFPEGILQVAQPFAGPLPSPIALIESDLMSDPFLETALRSDGLFDAVTIWLTGAHMLRAVNVANMGRGVRNEAELRIFLQNAVYELADRILRPGGVLQVIDRSDAPTDVLKYQAYLQSHREQAEPTTLDVRDIRYRLWTRPEGGRTQMIRKVPEGGTADAAMALVSIISVKV
jgi:SAM-dependent methyltransferase